MTGKTHIIGGIAAATAVTSLFGIYEPRSVTGLTIYGGAFLLPAVVGALAPDIDHGNSKASNVNLFTKIASIFLRIVCGHRGVIHSPFFLSILCVIGFVLTIIFPFPLVRESIFGFLIGYASHLFIDFFNKEGIPVLFPFVWNPDGKPKKYHLLGLPEGGLIEWVMRGLLFVASIYMICVFAMKVI